MGVIKGEIGGAVAGLPGELLPVWVEGEGDGMRRMGGVKWGMEWDEREVGVDEEVRRMRERIKWDELHHFL